MTIDQLKRFIFVSITTMYETEGYCIPRSTLYLVIQCNMSDFQLIEDALVTCGKDKKPLITVTPNTWTLTEAGIAVAKELKVILEKGNSQHENSITSY